MTRSIGSGSDRNSEVSLWRRRETTPDLEMGEEREFLNSWARRFKQLETLRTVEFRAAFLMGWLKLRNTEGGFEGLRKLGEEGDELGAIAVAIPAEFIADGEGKRGERKNESEKPTREESFYLFIYLFLGLRVGKLRGDP